MANDLPNRSLIPFVVAVTGHRDPRPGEMKQLRHEVIGIFEGMRTRMPSTPLVLLSGMAEGADQFVAGIALELGISLVAVLPMPLDIYRTTMSEAAQKTMDDQLARATVQITLPVTSSPEQLLADEEARSWCYEALAQFLAQHCQALIALWDGKHSEKRGGTSRVVHYVRSGSIHQDSQDSDEPESRCGMVYHVTTPRLSGDGTPDKICTIMLGCEMPDQAGSDSLEPDEEPGKTTFAQVENNFEDFNAESLRLKVPASRDGSGFIDDPSVTLSPFQQRLHMLFGQADAISIQANSRRRHYLRAMLATAIIGTLVYGLHIKIHGRVEYLWPIFPLFAGIAVLLHWHARKHHIEERYLDYRALAEALRVQFFWDMAGIGQPVDRYYLTDRRTKLDWIRAALKNVWLLNQSRVDDKATPNRKAVLQYWVEDQRKWYLGKAEGQSKSVRQRERSARYALIVAVACALLAALGLIGWNHLAGSHLLASAKPLPQDSMLNEFFHICLALPLLLAGAYRLWVEQAGYEEQSREYRFMQRQFSRKAAAIEAQLDSPDAVEALLLELGIEALKENGRWLLLHRDRPLEALGGM